MKMVDLSIVTVSVLPMKMLRSSKTTTNNSTFAGDPSNFAAAAAAPSEAKVWGTPRPVLRLNPFDAQM